MLTVTLVSLVVAAASGFVAWRSVRREHLRTDARIAWLATAIDSSSPRGSTELDNALDWFGQESGLDRTEAVFEEREHQETRRRPLLTAMAGLAVILVVVVVIAITGDRYDAPAPAVPARVEALELLSLDAAREGATLAVTGVVRNRADEPLNAITAIVSAVDAQGHAVGRGFASLTPLSPGRQSRFVVTIARVNGAARYRVSFRGATGAVIRHMDRRERTSADS